MNSRKKKKGGWWIYYRMGHSDYDEDIVVVMPSVAKLLLWIARNGSKCCEVEIKLIMG